MTQSKLSEWVRFLLPVLYEVLKGLGYMSQSIDKFKADESYDYQIVDMTELIVTRSFDTDAQREEYSGKKKETSSYWRFSSTYPLHDTLPTRQCP